MKSIHHVFFLFISCLSYVVIHAQELPPVINYSSAQYQGGNQNWMISQSSDRQIFIANTKGLLQFNGARWKIYPEPNESIIRSVRAIDDRIYTGSYMNFGYWEHNPLGELQYVSLIESLDIPIIEDEQFWNIIAHYKWIIFQSLDRIIIFNTENNGIQIIDSEGIISKLFRVKNEIYFHVLGEGIYVIEDGKKQLLSNHQVVLENRVIGLFSITNELVLITEEAGFYKLNGALVNRWDTRANSVLDGMSIYCAIQLKNEDIALGSIAHGVLIISKQGEIRHRFDRSNGLGNNTVLSLFPDADNNVWVG
ncbi:MAG: hypothetical protein HKO54_06900, partial [Flavobacteriaceae bacterium]|nr:hypothetical protein [Flavobacteriaceae bacterium]